MPLFAPVITSSPPERNVSALLPLYWQIAKDISRHDGRSAPAVMARILYARIRYGFGAEQYRLYRFNRKSLSDYRDFLTIEERDASLRRVSSPDHRDLAENKVVFYEHCVRHGLSTPKIFGLILKNRETESPAQSLPCATNEGELASLLQTIPDGKYVVKPIDGAHGWGVTLIRISGGEVTTQDGTRISAAEMFRECANQRYTKLGFLIQEYLTSHRDLLPLMPGPGLGSFRIITFVWPDNSVYVYYAEIKIPGEGRITSNFSGGEGGSFLCRIDIETSRIVEAIGATQAVPITTTIRRHPVTDVEIAGMPIPMWTETMDLIQRSAKAFSGLKTLGWDVAITDNGPTLMETNWGYGHDSMEITLNRGIRKEFHELIERAAGNGSAR